MSLDAWISVLVVTVAFVVLASGRFPPYLVLLGGLTLIVLLGILEPAEAFQGFANTGLVTVAVLFVVAAGLRQTGIMGTLVQLALGRPKTATAAQLRLGGPVLLGSAFMNNTPVVAMLLPVVLDWCKVHRIAPSKLLLPLSYTAILGGTCTLIGTSTNIVTNGLLVERGYPSLALFDLSWVGLPAAVVGMGFLLLAARWLLPSRNGHSDAARDPREYTAEVLVADTNHFAGKSYAKTGLSETPGLELVEVYRNRKLLGDFSPEAPLEAGDRLVFIAGMDAVLELRRTPGLTSPDRNRFELESRAVEHCFVEVVVSRTCPLAGQTIREAKFRNRYGAVVLAAARNGARLNRRVGDIVLRVGDTLLVEAHTSFVEQQRAAKDFSLVSRLGGATPPTSAQAPLSLFILLCMIGLVTTGLLSMLQSALLAAAAMLIFRCCSEETARQSVDWPLLLTIGASFGLGAALEQTGAANVAAELLLAPAGNHAWLALVAIYGATSLLSNLVTNNAAAVIVFPIALSTAEQLGVNHVPFAIVLMVAASASFATPLGYQTNLMVYAPGGYRFSDFMKMGVPMNLLVGIVTCLIAPLVWPFK